MRQPDRGFSLNSGRQRNKTIATSIAVFALVIAGAAAWQWMKASSPITVVDRAGQAIKVADWKTVYHLIDWSDEQKRMLDENRFVTLAGIYSKVYVLQDYKIGTPNVTGDTATVPVTMTAKISSLISTKTKTDKADVKCHKVEGEWKLSPDLKNGLLGLNNVGIGSL
jgi:hypothetical protein